jgi:acyl carrier protein
MTSMNHPTVPAGNGTGRLTPSASDLSDLFTAIAGSDVRPDEDLFLAGVNSLDLVRVIGAVHAGYGVQLTAVDILDHPTAQDLAAYLRDKTGGAAND